MAKFTIKENAESRYLLNIITIHYCSSDKNFQKLKYPTLRSTKEKAKG